VSSASLGDKPGTGSAKPSIVRGFRRESSITIIMLPMLKMDTNSGFHELFLKHTMNIYTLDIKLFSCVKVLVFGLFF
jgi:hypothetical protein